MDKPLGSRLSLILNLSNWIIQNFAIRMEFEKVIKESCRRIGSHPQTLRSSLINPARMVIKLDTQPHLNHHRAHQGNDNGAIYSWKWPGVHIARATLCHRHRHYFALPCRGSNQKSSHPGEEAECRCQPGPDQHHKRTGTRWCLVGGLRAEKNGRLSRALQSPPILCGHSASPRLRQRGLRSSSLAPIMISNSLLPDLSALDHHWEDSVNCPNWQV